MLEEEGFPVVEALRDAVAYRDPVGTVVHSIPAPAPAPRPTTRIVPIEVAVPTVASSSEHASALPGSCREPLGSAG